MIDGLLTSWDGERLVVSRDHETGGWILIALHSTQLGPAAGGTRMKPYPSLDAALEDVLRLSEGMTYKFAAPGLPFGGAKAVIAVPDNLNPEERQGLLRRYGEQIAQLDGTFLTGPDVGTSPEDMDVIAETGAPHVFSRTPAAGGAGDPGPYTALGVLTAIEVVGERLGLGVGDARIVVQGAGDVGGPLLEMLIATGASVAFSEIDEELNRRYRDEWGIESIAPDQALAAPCDVLAPCALGGVLSQEAIPYLRCRAIAGSANNQLATSSDGVRLADRGILYAPDFVTNVGGAMAISGMEALGWSPAEADHHVRTYVAATLRAIFDTAASEGIDTAAAARRIAEHRLGKGG
jgi:glutamate dehydrogenase/leucine dehydrogenase